MALPFTLKPALLLSVLHNRQQTKNNWKKLSRMERTREKEEEEVKQDVLAFLSCFHRAHHCMWTMELFATQGFSLEGLAKGGRGEIKGV